MSFIYEKNFMYIETYELESNEIKELIKEKISLVTTDIDYDIYINCVKNKNMEKLGYSYGWISNESLFNILIGLNLDGTERIERKIIENENLDNTEDTEDWGAAGDDMVYEEKYLEPLVDFQNAIKINEAFIINNNSKQNILFTENTLVEKDFNLIKIFFNKFNKDKFQNKYPLVNIKKKNTKTLCTVKFSPRHPHLASFVLNLVKKINFNNNLYFFSQTKNNNYERR